jgi:hypothetical protein
MKNVKIAANLQTNLPIYNISLTHPIIYFQNVIATPVTEAVTINFQPVKVSPDTLQPTMIADVIFDRKFFQISIKKIYF